jgi:hypothetical protein
VAPAVQALPQRPQLVLLVWRFTHWPLQSVWPVGQAQAPMTQVDPPPHATPQRPQFVLLVCRLVQTLLQTFWPVGH